MSRPTFVTTDDISRWKENIDEDPTISDDIKASPVIREVCYSGLWLAEQLYNLNCPESLIVRIQFTAGKLSFGRDPWEVHQFILEQFISDKLEIEDDTEDYSSMN